MTKAWRFMRNAVLAVVALAAWSGTALAQEFEKVENIPRQEIPAGRFVSIAYGIIWLAVLTYVVFVAAGMRRVDQQIADLKRRLGNVGNVGSKG
ncbi:MAG TPA: CcmD family protein [Polyangia bacterium]|jgi:CcmD family protein|nr:CcmD family protein [Polyangia bacterium]